MKRFVVAALLVVGITTYAQVKRESPQQSNIERMSPEERQEKQIKRMTAELNLNSTQQFQIKQLLADQSANREKKINRNDLSKAEKKDKRETKIRKIQENQKIMEEKMTAILSPEQFTTWKTNQEKIKQKIANRVKDKRDGTLRNEIEN